jgi:ATP-grasp domain-containing protein
MIETLVVVYDDGAAHPGDIAVGLADWARCVFVAEPGEHAIAMAPLLGQFGPVVIADSAAEIAVRVRDHAPGGVVTFSERALPLAGDIARELSLPFHDSRTIGVLTDKWRQRLAFRAAGVDATRCHRVQAEPDWAAAVAETGLPAVLKPAQGGGSRNTYRIDDADTGLAMARQLLAEESPGLLAGGTLVLEEYITGRDCGPFGDYVSIESIVQAGQVTHLAVTGKFPMVPPFRETGRFWPSPLSPEEDEQVCELAGLAVKALGVVTGLTHTEVKLTRDGPQLIEVNGRLGGGINELAIRAAGLNLIEMAGRVALAEPVALPPLYRGQAYFQLFHPAPRWPCRLIGINGIDQVRKIPGVTLYRPYARAGTELPGGVQTRELDIVMGEAEDVADLAVIAEAVNSALRYTFDFTAEGPDGKRAAQRSVTGAELGEL